MTKIQYEQLEQHASSQDPASRKASNVEASGEQKVQTLHHAEARNRQYQKTREQTAMPCTKGATEQRTRYAVND
jgi:hypothetical protein